MKINELKLYSTRLDEQMVFYSETLGLSCIEKSEKRVSFQVGRTKLTFEYRENATPYHFAINIPSNKENEALIWSKKRVDILKDEGLELHDFDSWNAKAMYFYDPDRNIVELIARKNLRNDQFEAFDQQQFLCVSEIGMPTTSIASKFSQLHQLTNIKEFNGEFNRFLAFGDDEGLFICINKDIKDWFPTGDKAYSSDFELLFSVDGKDFRIDYRNDEITALTV